MYAILFLDDVKSLSQAVAILNNTVGNIHSKDALSQLNQLSQYNSIPYEFIFVGEKV